jgi:hypothetical protein
LKADGRRLNAYIPSVPLLRPIRLHRHPAVDALLWVAALAVAFLLLRSAVASTGRMVIVADSTRFDGAAALYDTRLLADSLPYRVTGGGSARHAAAWLASRFEQLGLRVEHQTFDLWLHGQKVRGDNVVARSRGRERGAILLVAHYDGPTTSSQSAAASASGVGTLMELARVLESRPHRHPFVYVALDAGTWGQAGAAAVAASPLGQADSVLAAISIDHVANGAHAGVAVAGVGQGDGYAPLWLRVAAADALARNGTAVRDVGFLEEWYLRTIRLSEEDQGPLVACGVPAVNLGTLAANPSYASFLYHTPGDRLETLDPRAFRALGAGIERLVLSLDRNPRMTGSFTYLRVGGGNRMIRGVAILLAAILLFVPLLFTTWEAVGTARVEPAARAAIRSEVATAVNWWLIGCAGWLALRGLVAVGTLPRYQLYPAAERDPFLYDVDWLPIVVCVGVMLLAAFGLARLRRRLHLVAANPFAGRAVSLSTLALLAAIALVRNPFAAVWLLALPAWLWPWIGPSRRAMTGAAGTLLVVLSVAPALVIAFLVGRHFQLGVRTGWYLFLQAAYGAWSPLTTVMAIVLVLAAGRLIGTAAVRLLPDSGD